jgi:hypothetical protein
MAMFGKTNFLFRKTSKNRPKGVFAKHSLGHKSFYKKSGKPNKSLNI